ncbi:MAG TPA: DUF3857 domain-containing protein [Terriglobales bacterium]|nr:DUF3857 domain-containing protein [Terriglobales bacterium]
MKTDPTFRRFLLAIVLTLAAVTTLSAATSTAQRKGSVRSRTAQALENAIVRQAAQGAEALFVRSDLQGARAAASSVLRSRAIAERKLPALRQARLNALFVEMEAAALQGDTSSVLDSAMSIVELSSTGDPRAEIAAARILDLSANSSDFRGLVPRIQKALAARSAQSSNLRASLITAAADGLSGVSMIDLTRDAGLLTDWRVVGPFGKYPNLAFDQTWAPERDGMSQSVYGGVTAERFQFATGTFELADYVPSTGVMYAASEVTTPESGAWILRVESPGSLQVFVDGVLALSKDDRFHATPELVWKSVQLSAGTHRVMVKFLPTAAPFRVAVLQTSNTGDGLEPVMPPIMLEYVSAARAYWSGDYGSAIEQLTRLRGEHDSASVNYLLAQAWANTDDSFAERRALLEATLRLAPTASAAEYELALKDYSDNNPDDALARARRIVGSQPRFEPAVRLLAKTASALNWHAEATKAHNIAVDLHPSCSVVQQSSAFFSSIADYASAAPLEARLEGCAPASLAWAETLAKAGQHQEAAAAAQRVVDHYPLDRAAHAMLVRELLMAGRRDEANTVARQLSALAPNSTQFRRMVESLSAARAWSENTPPAAIGFADSQEFFTPYRRDGIAIIKQTSERHFSGGPAVTLLHDRVAQLRPDGGVSLYVHKTTRVLNRDGILIYGEVSLPPSASVLELRTIKVDGTIAEPEFNQHKATISMPALSPGDAIDMEYVVRYPETGLDEHSDAFQFTFGSFAAPMLYSRFVVLTPSNARVEFAPFGDVPAVRVRDTAGVVARVWERNDIAQSTPEVSTPRSGVLPEVRMYPVAGGWADVREFYRNAFIEATRVGTRVTSVAESITGTSDEARLRSAYRLVTSRIHSVRTDYSSGEFASAESTLAAYTGSRTAALLALSSAMGISADVLMTREAGSPPPVVANRQAYSRPLIVFHCKEGTGTRKVVIDAENEGIGFGGIAARIEPKDALLVSLDGGRAQNSALIAAVPAAILDERSVADADVTFDEAGNLSARVTIRMGAARSAQMRSILAGIEPNGRKHFFEQLAMRIFPGAADAQGEVRNETDSDHPLEIVLTCRAPHFANFSAQTADLDQLVPALGLRKMYVQGGSRRSPLYVDTPLIETATFRVTLPPSMRFAALAGNVTESNDFGSYSVTFRERTENSVEIRREFTIPVQVIQPGRFELFSRFARLIDDAERQRLLVGRRQVTAATAAR